MNETELKVSLLLLNKMELPGVISVEPDFAPEPESLDGMLTKGFIKRDGDGTGWNPFVKMVLWTAVNAQSELSVKGGTRILCRLYFYEETMILMTKDMDKELFVFYYVPLLPKAIGGLAKCLETLELLMPSGASGKRKIVSLPPEAADDFELLKSLSMYAGLNQIDRELTPVTVDGWCFSEHSLERVLIETEDGIWLARREGDHLELESVGFYDFIQSISPWIVQTHGKSIAEKKEKNDG
ncbi:hypothetical protein [uncultured Mailhella sp.]|uniref:hypothetical protein n=1 Tax=uncultured Mailhella sp. TaxID=1981031 RepID=UPI00261B9327|nr:hypothetical protein [uncultured Mailhella sp.]